MSQPSYWPEPSIINIVQFTVNGGETGADLDNFQWVHKLSFGVESGYMIEVNRKDFDQLFRPSSICQP